MDTCCLVDVCQECCALEPLLKTIVNFHAFRNSFFSHFNSIPSDIDCCAFRPVTERHESVYYVAALLFGCCVSYYLECSSASS